MRMKFFERTYLLMLTLFLIFLNGSIFSLVLYTHHNTLLAEEQVCISEELTVREAFERDYKSDQFGSDHLLQITYGLFYKEKDILLSFTDTAGEVYSTLPEGLSSPAEGKLSSQFLDGTRYILITERICDGKFVMTYAKDVSHLDEDFKKLTVYFISASFAASVLLAVFMYLALRRLYAPLDRLRTVTQTISGGDLCARADESGNDEFSDLAKDFNRMADRVTEQMDELRATAVQKQRMLDDLAHEMRTPLTGIHGYAEYI
ncbi:MAG: HAMP domain-containing protein [Clostridia bacterium]|nr:HAMP domain-containing protein [Clostridia bacterium]